MKIHDIKDNIIKHIDKGCNGTVYILDETTKEIKVLEITGIDYMYDIVESGTEGVFITAKTLDSNYN